MKCIRGLKSWIGCTRDDRHLLGPTVAENTWLKEIVIDIPNLTKNEESAYLLNCVQRNYRHTWNINPSQAAAMFYRYFRLIGIVSNMSDGDDVNQCMHGVGAELYGDVNEE